MEKVKFTPTGKTVLIKKKEAAKKTAAGIIIPEGSKEDPLMGTIVAVSNYASSVGYKEGQNILFRRYREQNVKIDGTNYIIIDDIEENIFGIFE